MAVVFISKDVRDEFAMELSNCGHNVIKIPKNPKLYTAIESHPDIVLCQINDTLFIEKTTYDYISEKNPNFSSILSDFKIVITPDIEIGKYPHDVRLNLAYTGKYALHNFKHTDALLTKHLVEKDVELVQISQGYSKCSILVVDENSIITGDKGIYDQVKDKLDCLLINQGDVLLKGMEYGFIGGASGKYLDEIWFYGDIYSHLDYDRILDFITRRGLKIKGFSEYPLEDIGSVVFVY